MIHLHSTFCGANPEFRDHLISLQIIIKKKIKENHSKAGIVTVGRAAKAEDRGAAAQLRARGPLCRKNFQQSVSTVVIVAQGCVFQKKVSPVG